MKNLLELTGQESGIVIYDGKEAIVCNWSGINGYPRLFVTGILGLGEEIPDTVGSRESLSPLLDGVRVVYANGEEVPEYGTVYRITDEITIIAPDGWC